MAEQSSGRRIDLMVASTYLKTSRPLLMAGAERADLAHVPEVHERIMAAVAAVDDAVELAEERTKGMSNGGAG